mmetsp:Transcript_7002/g.15215  ORF Transcript_7002/g.15215 Transcript_7002/m.15215 type:complete len:242 (-) Transcript_7002:1185-1910(-)
MYLASSAVASPSLTPKKLLISASLSAVAICPKYSSLVSSSAFDQNSWLSPSVIPLHFFRFLRKISRGTRLAIPRVTSMGTRKGYATVAGTYHHHPAIPHTPGMGTRMVRLESIPPASSAPPACPTDVMARMLAPCRVHHLPVTHHRDAHSPFALSALWAGSLSGLSSVYCTLARMSPTASFLSAVPTPAFWESSPFLTFRPYRTLRTGFLRLMPSGPMKSRRCSRLAPRRLPPRPPDAAPR